MNIPKYARYDYCVEKACEFLEEFDIDSYPVDIERIISLKKWALTPYSDLMKEFNCDRDTVIRCLRSKDGYTQLDNNNYSIAFNDDPSLGKRRRFTLMHEVGHIYLGHLRDFDITLLNRGALTQEQNLVLEYEANAFARNVLVPIPMYYYKKNQSAPSLQTAFDISYDAAATRIDLIQKDYDCSHKLGLYPRFMKIYSAFMDKKKCSNCGVGIVQRRGSYCPICGSNNTLQWGDGDKMKFKTYETTENGRLKECIKCHNDELVGAYCHICGSPVENYCIDANSFFNSPDSCDYIEPLPANARFCQMCGGETTFNQKGILIDWSQELKQIEEAENNATNNTFMNIPEGIEDELPFDSDDILDMDDELPFN